MSHQHEGGAPQPPGTRPAGAATTKAPAPAPASEPEPVSARRVARRRWRQVRWVLLAVLVLILVGLLIAALRPRTSARSLDPESPSQDGSRALVQIVGGHGTPVKIARSVDAAAEQLRAAPDAVLVIVRSDRLVRSELGTLRSLPGDRLLVEPSARTLAELAPQVEEAGLSISETPRPGCGLRAATLAGEVSFGRAITYDTPPGATRCYLAQGKPQLVQLAAEGRTVTVLGSGEPLTNDRLTTDGNAALAMNLLEARSSAVWLIPDLPTPGSGGEESLSDLAPFGVKLAALQLVIAVVLVALWRARRLGPVVAEPLPVVVRSAEAVEGRARLYRSRRATDRAADALRAGSRERMVPLLGLPGSAAQDPSAMREIVTALAARTGHGEATIGPALYGPAPMNDAELVRLADFLDDLERQVRQS